jgi:hypothetical protein
MVEALLYSILINTEKQELLNGCHIKIHEASRH